jgi:hypothetical protein
MTTQLDQNSRLQLGGGLHAGLCAWVPTWVGEGLQAPVSAACSLIQMQTSRGSNEETCDTNTGSTWTLQGQRKGLVLCVCDDNNNRHTHTHRPSFNVGLMRRLRHTTATDCDTDSNADMVHHTLDAWWAIPWRYKGQQTWQDKQRADMRYREDTNPRSNTVPSLQANATLVYHTPCTTAQGVIHDCRPV